MGLGDGTSVGAGIGTGVAGVAVGPQRTGTGVASCTGGGVGVEGTRVHDSVLGTAPFGLSSDWHPRGSMAA